jgi:hypothetical protein
LKNKGLRRFCRHDARTLGGKPRLGRLRPSTFKASDRWLSDPSHDRTWLSDDRTLGMICHSTSKVGDRWLSDHSDDRTLDSRRIIKVRHTLWLDAQRQDAQRQDVIHRLRSLMLDVVHRLWHRLANSNISRFRPLAPTKQVVCSIRKNRSYYMRPSQVPML